MRFFSPQITRRDFLKSGGIAAVAPLTVGLNAVGKVAIADGNDGLISDFVRVFPDDRVVVVVKHVEAGQGPTTGLATLVAEEMNADWDKVETVFAPADNSRYANLFWGTQGTGGSTAMANSFAQYRKAGAAALARLKSAAAAEWQTTPQKIRAENGVLQFGDKRAAFGEMAVHAAKIPLDEFEAAEPALKSPKDFSYIGREKLPRKDLSGKTNGQAMYAMDFRPDNLLYAVVARSPKFGGTLKNFNDSESRKINGFAGAKAIPSGVAVYGETLWAAMKARRALKTEWDFSAAETRSSGQILADYWKAMESPGIVARSEGDVDAALKVSAKTITADFSVPFLAHAPMEPLNCTMEFRNGKATLWDGCQAPGWVQKAVADVFGIPPENVDIVSLFAGGTFGRRATPTNDYQVEAAHALKNSPLPNRPLKTIWTREDDIQGGYYRPMFVHRIHAGIDADGNISAWRQNLAGKSIIIGTPFEGFLVKDGVDSTSVEGAANLSYASPNIFADVRNMQESPISVLWWRSVGHTHTAFSTESAMDMLAAAAGEDAVEFRLRHLSGHPRHAEVLRVAANAAKWNSPAPAGRFRGVAVHESFNSFVAQVVEISLNKKGEVKVEKVTCAVDCGIAINPDIVRAQMESGIGYALGTAMRNQIVLKNGGEVAQTNFPNYNPLRIHEMPKVETHIVNSGNPPTGVGEPGVPPLAPALAGAIFAATGKRVTHLPFASHGIAFT